MATYNGERYLSQQIDSLLNQTYNDFTIYISDDHSTDGTFDILKSYSEKYPDKIKVSQNETNSGNAKYNFMNMMIDHKDDYIMLCDQDDIWKEDKVEKSLAKIRSMEDEYGNCSPILIHTDLIVVDKDLNVINPSFRGMTFKKDYSSLSDIIAQNIVTGCTVMYNKALADMINDVPKFFIMHDWWLAILVSAMGKIGYISNGTIFYRQHGFNVLGAKENVLDLKYKIRVITNRKQHRQIFMEYCKQAKSFLDMYGHMLDEYSKNILKAYADLRHLSKIRRLKLMRKNNLLPNGIYHTIRYLILG